jgi:hypothetical protein
MAEATTAGQATACKQQQGQQQHVDNCSIDNNSRINNNIADNYKVNQSRINNMRIKSKFSGLSKLYRVGRGLNIRKKNGVKSAMDRANSKRGSEGYNKNLAVPRPLREQKIFQRQLLLVS